MTRTLFAITEDVMAINELLDEVEGDISRTCEMEPAVASWLTSLGEEMAAKLDSYAGLIRQLEMEAAAAREEAEQWERKSHARHERAAFLRKRLKSFMELTGQKKITTAAGRTISVAGNGGQKPIAWNLDIAPTEVGERFTTTQVVLDKHAVRDALEAGEELLFAELGNRGTHLKIS